MEKNIWLTSTELMNRWGINAPTLWHYIQKKNLAAYQIRPKRPSEDMRNKIIGTPRGWTFMEEPQPSTLNEIVQFLDALTFSIKDVVEFEKKGKSITGKPLSQNFEYSNDFRTVRKGDKEFSLTTKQAAVIQVLFEANEKGTPDISQEHLLDAAGSQGNRLRDLFKGGSNDEKKKANKEAWKNLIASGRRKGLFRLNI